MGDVQQPVGRDPRVGTTAGMLGPPEGAGGPTEQRSLGSAGPEVPADGPGPVLTAVSKADDTTTPLCRTV